MKKYLLLITCIFNQIQIYPVKKNFSLTLDPDIEFKAKSWTPQISGASHYIDSLGFVQLTYDPHVALNKKRQLDEKWTVIPIQETDLSSNKKYSAWVFHPEHDRAQEILKKILNDLHSELNTLLVDKKQYFRARKRKLYERYRELHQLGQEEYQRIENFYNQGITKLDDKINNILEK